MTTEEVFQLIREERHYQKCKWGNDENKSLGDFLTYMRHYLQEADKQLTKPGITDVDDLLGVKSNIRKLITLGVAALERHASSSRNTELP